MKHLSNNDFQDNLLANVPDGVAPQEAVNKRQLDTKVGLQSADITVTVGSGGDYANINEALESLSRMYPAYKSRGIRAEVELLSGFQMQEQVLVDGIDLGWITITSVDPTVTIDRQYLTQNFGEEPANSSDETNYTTNIHVTNIPAFGAYKNATLPVIDVLFDMNTSGPHEGRNAFSATNNSTLYIEPYKGCINAGSVGVYASQMSRVYAYRTNFHNAGRGIAQSGSDFKSAALVFRGSWANLRQSTLTNAARDAVYMGSSSVVEALGANFSGAGQYGIHVYAAGRINARDSNLSNCGVCGLYARNASIANVGGSTITGSGDRGVFAVEASVVNAQGASIQGASLHGIATETGATVNGGDATITGNATGILASRGSTVALEGANCSGNINADIRAVRGSIISAYGSTGTPYTPVNTLTANGIIFK